MITTWEIYRKIERLTLPHRQIVLALLDEFLKENPMDFKKAWIAQTKLVCYSCGKPILPGHKYVWQEVRRGTVVALERVHPSCQEDSEPL